MSADPDSSWEWWEWVPSTEEVTQGDVLREVLLEHNTEWNDLIVLTQACDFQKDGTTVITLCPFLPIEEWVTERIRHEVETRIFNGSDKAVDQQTVDTWLEKLASDEKYLHMVPLNDYEHGDRLGYFVNLSEPIALSSDYVDEWHAKQRDGVRLRLRPPYREYLGQAFARMYMRVACPIDVGTTLPDSELARFCDTINEHVVNGMQEIKAIVKEGKENGTEQAEIVQQKKEIAKKYGDMCDASQK